jgi:transposase
MPRQYRLIAATSVLCETLDNAHRQRGLVATRVEHPDATRRCHVCGYDHDWSPAEHLMHECGKCRNVWDQDYNAAVQQLRVGLSTEQAAPETGAGNRNATDALGGFGKLDSVPSSRDKR